MSKSKEEIPNLERRVLNVESRVDSKSRTVHGYAALYENTTSEMGWFDEEIAAGAFDGADTSDVRALFNHDPNWLLGRTKSGTLKLNIDEKGLSYEFDAPNTTAGNDLLEMLRRGDVSQSSFAFTIKKEAWIEGKGMKRPKRRILEIDRLYDVSPVTYPAYPDTTAAKRSFDAYHKDHEAGESLQIKKEQAGLDDRLRSLLLSLKNYSR